MNTKQIEIETQLREAIRTKTKVIIRYYYDGFNEEERHIYPHQMGINTKNNFILSAYQTKGATRSGEKAGWKAFKIDKISAITNSNEQFTIQAGYAPAPNNVISMLDCQV